MSNNETEFGYEIYHHARDFTEEELDAIRVLTGVRPYTSDEESDDEEDADYELMTFIVNAVQMRAFAPFDAKRLDALADLDTFGLYLLDTIHLVSRSRDPAPLVLALASLAAKMTMDVETAHGVEDREQCFQDLWAEALGHAGSLLDRSGTVVGNA